MVLNHGKACMAYQIRPDKVCKYLMDLDMNGCPEAGLGLEDHREEKQRPAGSHGCYQETTESVYGASQRALGTKILAARVA